ncbi:MAG: IMS domain-containing protein [Cyanobacteria bacterium P01_H01_bin.162]
MRIPLDHYRILGLPIQATTEQLKQAHRDRTLQLPRREYSEIAIESRKALIDEAYTLLADAEQRQSYDAQFLGRAYTAEALTPPKASPAAGAATELNPQVGEAALRSLASDPTPVPASEPYTPTVEIEDAQFVGALLILLELGEYELAIRLGRPFVTRGDANLDDGRYGEPQAVRADIVLTLALACLELGREQWQQNQYENAAESLETGQTLLVQENSFPVIRSELQSDLYKLRPYRVLELVARPIDQTAPRRQGVKLLKTMLQDRGGIDGIGDDLSGLSTDDCLRFIQQLRGYLTAGEQQEIFEAEARRPSAVATYLAVYALLARGFAFHQPALVRRAKQLLERVGARQDVYLEQAVCSLLLGHAEEAGRALERSQEYEPLAFIREHSQGSPDLLPGLCLYAERWLQEEVFHHFRDLAQQQTLLKDYFADPQVQSFLETMPAPAIAEPQPSTAAPDALATGATAFGPPPAMPTLSAPITPAYTDAPVGNTPSARPVADANTTPREEIGLSVAERVSQLSPEGQLQASGSGRSFAASQNGHRPSAAVVPPEPLEPGERSSRSPHWGRLAGVVTVGAVTMGLLGLVTVRAFSWVGSAFSGPRIQQPALDLSLIRPPVNIPTPPPPEAQIGVKDIAERTITTWLSAKREALGPEHTMDNLETALVEPVLTEWRNQALGGERDNWYYTFEHSVEVLSVEPDDPTAEALTVEAQVKEVAEYYELGVLNNRNSYDRDLNMRYELVRQEADWFIKSMEEIE